MKPIVAMSFVIAVSLLSVACDPGMTIRQTDAATSASEPIAIEVKTQHPLVSHEWYAPTVVVTNTSDSAITIASVELAAKASTYVNKPRRAESYPSLVDPGKTETLDTWFDLAGNVKKTFFRQPAALLVHYQLRGREQTAQVSIVGGPLDTSAP
jgi:hypothetical protein